jgi:hypothetical protein
MGEQGVFRRHESSATRARISDQITGMAAERTNRRVRWKAPRLGPKHGRTYCQAHRTCSRTISDARRESHPTSITRVLNGAHSRWWRSSIVPGAT